MHPNSLRVTDEPTVLSRTSIFPIRIRRIVFSLLLFSALLAVCHLASRYFTHEIASPTIAEQAWLDFFDLNSEAALGSWYNSSLWLVAAGLTFTVGMQSRQGGRSSWHWNGLAALFILLSLDEGAVLHESVGHILEENLQRGGIFYWSWVIYGIAVVAAVALLFGKFLLTLPRSALWTFAAGGALFLTGALGFEMYAANVASGDMKFFPGLGWSVSVMIEELLEMVGVIVTIAGLLRLLHDGTEVRLIVN